MGLCMRLGLLLIPEKLAQIYFLTLFFFSINLSVSLRNGFDCCYAHLQDSRKRI